MSQIGQRVEQMQEDAAELFERVKPRLRGWLHTGMFPTAMVAGLLLTVIAPTVRERIGTAVFTLTAGMLFGISAVYHRGTWSPGYEGLLKRFDHANIFLIIAGTYTPFALTLLPHPQDTQLLVIVWSGAIAGVLFRVLWVRAPRWLYVPIYVALGWVAVFYFKPLYEQGGLLIVTLITIGGLLYTAGAVVYGLKRPDPFPKWFGFHEIFHALTLLAFSAHFAAVVLAILRDR
ncbi:hemolysin III family protein [Yimella sp. cx-51]|uniref:PAQR family membrane homeostasis protein TrhA n=1 Tax=Yimella sp. cx-51 TaxID=2770551 RepID=UPI00165E0529|nr:hemolysin III family protein [Yimella sp. cx-51]MBC9958269.1 hemolysin III family protein [Yimella sp. cx-51]QTH38704.1 hemolysin III family protein [Yimella sp. cx-51]